MIAASKSRSDRSSDCRVHALRRPRPRWGKAIVPGEETGTCTLGAAGVLIQTRKERSAEITSGRTVAQLGLTATCKDRPQETLSKAAGGQRSDAWARRSDEVGVMSCEEAPDVSCMKVAPVMQQRGPGRLAVPRRSSDTAPRQGRWKRGDELVSKPAQVGCMYVSA